MQNIKKTILIIGALDTKGEECLYIRDLVARSGLNSLIIDFGTLGKPTLEGDISREAVAARTGCELRQLIQTGDKGKIIQTMTEGVTAWVNELYTTEKIHGVIALGGGQGTAMGTAAMQLLPIGFPKVMVSTIASGNMRPFIHTKDIAVFHSVTDVFGLNFVFTRILKNAVAALVAMTQTYKPIQKGTRTVIGATAFGVTTPGLMKMKRTFNGIGIEMVFFHANGIGGQAMEEMAAAGYFDAVIDWSTQEIIAEVGEGIFSAGQDRLEILAKTNLPYIIAPGAIDYITMGPYETLPESWKKRNLIIHNRHITLVRATAREMRRAAEFLCLKVNRAIGPVKILIPLKGFSEPNAEGKPFYDPEADQAFLGTLEKHLREDIELVKVDAHINDDEFVETAVQHMMSKIT
ncbi:MAG: Tm-1-like ATP-binding domain-containing protein [Desulfobacterales bacterium]|nr:MAG: Tm-1-like ATP-binding domain-containing protein [Desulfobacterales bacterium]